MKKLEDGRSDPTVGMLQRLAQGPRRAGDGAPRMRGTAVVLLGASRVCESKEVANDAETELRGKLRRQVEQTEQQGLAPVTVKALFGAYVLDLETRGKGADTVGRAAQTATAMERVLPELLAVPVGKVKDADIFTFREKRQRSGAKPSTINRDLRTIRAMFKRARPEYKFLCPST